MTQQKRKTWLRWLQPNTRRREGVKSPAEHTSQSPSNSRPAYPAPPREMLDNRFHYEEIIFNRRGLKDRQSDTPLAALYRIYEHIVLDQNINMRNELEYFWYKNRWAVCDIPDPRDPDEERYACLACIPALLCLAFNDRIRLGLPRDAPAIFTDDMLDAWRQQDRPYETEPKWAANVKKLKNTLTIPHWDAAKHDFVSLDGFSSGKACPEFARKNVLIWQPHIYFA